MDEIEDYWDESEFKFYNTLHDEDKLLYLYDLFLGDFTSDVLSISESNEIDFDFELDNDFDDSDTFRPTVTAAFDAINNTMVLSGAEVDVLDKVAGDLMMNGVLLCGRVLTVNSKGSTILTYNMLDNGPPISLN